MGIMIPVDIILYMDEENKKEDKIVKFPLRIPKRLVDGIEETAKKHYRSLNSEFIVAIEDYLTNWKNKH